MFAFLKNLISFLVKYKNGVTNFVGIVYAFVSVVQPLLASQNVSPTTWISTIAVFIVSYLTGKTSA